MKELQEALQAIVNLADAHIAENLDEKTDCVKLREQIDALATAIGIKPHAITTDCIDDLAYQDNDDCEHFDLWSEHLRL